MSTEYDYIIVGGGTVGCVLASRLSHADHRVAVFEAGPENYSEQIMSPTGGPLLHATEWEYQWKSVKQAHLGNREIANYGGKILSGSSAVNYGLWARGHSVDFDDWARLVGDDRWNYANLLKYLKKSESFHDRGATASIDQHGYDGPISNFSGLRKYPLKEKTLKAVIQSGIEHIPDGNNGNPLGVAPFTDNVKNALRQPAGLAYDLSKAAVFTNAVVARVETDQETKSATGITLDDGRTFNAKEVIVCAGAIKTPQILMLSGIGPREHLESLGITTIVDLPVGQNFHDHISGSMFWKLRNHEQGLAMGSPKFNDPGFRTGMPFDWIVTITVPDEVLSPAATADGTSINATYGSGLRGHVEILMPYAPIASAGTSYRIPPDGTHVATPVVILLPTSRGSITLASTKVADEPILDPNYLATEIDRTIMRQGFRAAIRIMETPEALTYVEHETPPLGYPRLTSSCTDEEIDARLAHVGASMFQNAGTASMGTVVDTDCRVKGIKGLRVADASIIPVSLASHYQAAIYGIAEAISDIILESNN
jgi:choline dehydrogenase-like flavoprotein